MERITRINLPTVDSTNDFVREMIEAERTEQVMSVHSLPGLTLVVADDQTAGRGQRGNTWETEKGKNLMFSLLCHPDFVKPAEQFILSQCMAVAIQEALSRYVSDVQVKWPNDIYVGDQKVGGILIENRLAGSHIRDCVIGIGLNVNQKEFKSEAPNPVSMLQLEGKEWDREEVLRGIIDLFVWQLEHFRRDKIREKYRRHLYRREGFHNYRDAKGDFEAELVTVEDDGHLVLRDKAGNLRSYAFKEVQFVI